MLKKGKGNLYNKNTKDVKNIVGGIYIILIFKNFVIFNHYDFPYVKLGNKCGRVLYLLKKYLNNQLKTALHFLIFTKHTYTSQ